MVQKQLLITMRPESWCGGPTLHTMGAVDGKMSHASQAVLTSNKCLFHWGHTHTHKTLNQYN